MSNCTASQLINSLQKLPPNQPVECIIVTPEGGVVAAVIGRTAKAMRKLLAHFPEE